MWGGTDENDPVRTVHRALDQGVRSIDTAPVYGTGEGEKVVGRAVREYGVRSKVVIATKAGLQWDDKRKVSRNASRERIMKEVEDSLERLQTDYIDIYQIHWPDHNTPMEETATAMRELWEEGTIRAIGVSNFSVDQMEAFMEHAPLHTCQPPYNIFEREAEELFPFCRHNDITLMTYGALCRGLLSGKMQPDQTFNRGDLRSVDPKFGDERFTSYLEAVDQLKEFARASHNTSVLNLAVRYILDKGVDSAIWGARRPEQVTFDEVFGWSLSEDELQQIDDIVEGIVEEPVGPEFIAPAK